MENDEIREVMDENKKAIQNEIFGKMQRMNDLFIDLSEDEIDQIQEILEYDSSSDDDVRSEVDFEWLPASSRLPVPFTSKIENDNAGQSYVSNLNFGDDMDQGAIGNHDNSESNDVDTAANVALNVGDGIDQDANQNHDDVESNRIHEAANATLNSVELNSEYKANNQNDSRTVPYFSPPSTSSSNAYLHQIPNHFVRLDPNLHDILSKRPINGNSGGNLNGNSNGNLNASKSQMTLDEILEFVESLFPGQCTYVS